MESNTIVKYTCTGLSIVLRILNALSCVCIVFAIIKWLGLLRELSCLLLPIVSGGKWSIVLNRSGFSQSCCDDLLILASPWGSDGSAILKILWILQ